MIDLDNELAADYLADSAEHLASIELCLLLIEKSGAEIDEEAVNRAFRAMHSVRGGAGVFDLVKIGDLAHQAEEVLALFRSRKMAPTPERIRVLLAATDKLKEMIQIPRKSNKADIGQVMGKLAGLLAEHRTSAMKVNTAVEGPERQGNRPLRVLLVEDDFASRLLLQTFLSRYGDCHIAVNGWEAVEAVRSAFEQGLGYGLICMDIMMPEMDGREAVRQIRAIEESHGVLSTNGAKIIMTTAVDDVKEVIRCFKELCDAYLFKPIELSKLLDHLKSFQLVQ